MEFKADWPEVCYTLGFKGHGSVAAPCFFCDCSGGTMHDLFDNFDRDDFKGSLITQDVWAKEVEKCTKKVVVKTQTELKAILARTHCDQRKSYGFKGRAMFKNFGPLIKGDRLEPTAQHRDVHEIDTVEKFPLTLQFWRTQDERRLNRANLFFVDIPGFTFEAISSCSLHVLDLGVTGLTQGDSQEDA